MKLRFLLIFVFVLPHQAFAEEIHWLKEGYHFGDAFIAEDGATLVAESHSEGFDSVLYLMRNEKVQREWVISDLRVNAVRFARGERGRHRTILVGGSTGSERSSRIYHVDGKGKLTKQWDSLNLGEAYEDAEVFISHDGRIWFASWYTDQSARIEVGTTEEYNTFWQWKLDLDDAWLGPSDLESCTTTVLDSNPETVSVALLWRGIIRVLARGEEPRQLVPPAGYQVMVMFYHPEAEILWGIASGRLTGFSLALGASVKPDSLTMADYEIDTIELGIGGIVSVHPRESGEMILQTTRVEGSAIYILDIPTVKHPRPKLLVEVEARTGLYGGGLITRASRAQGSGGLRVQHLPATRRP